MKWEDGSFHLAAKFGDFSKQQIMLQVVYSSLYPSMQSEQTNSKDEIDGSQLFVDNMTILMKQEEGSFHLAAKFGHFSKQ